MLAMPVVGGVGRFAGGLEPFNLVDFDGVIRVLLELT